MPIHKRCQSIVYRQGRTYNKTGFIQHLGRGSKGEGLIEMDARTWRPFHFPTPNNKNLAKVL